MVIGNVRLNKRKREGKNSLRMEVYGRVYIDFDFAGNQSSGFGHNCDILLYLENVMVQLISLQKRIKLENIYDI